MRPSRTLLITVAVLAGAGCSGAEEQPADDVADVLQDGEDSDVRRVPVQVSTQLVDPEGSELGTAWFRDDDGRAVVEVQVAGLTEGFHPMYLYSAGTCDVDAGAAGGAALRELPALLVLEDGVGSMTTVAGPMTLDSLLEEDGTALLIAPAVETLADVPPVPGEEDAPVLGGSQVACGVVEG